MTAPEPHGVPAEVAQCCYCVDGHRPAGIDPHLGPIYHGCTTCGDACIGCEGRGVFPADPRELREFITSCNREGWAPIFCPACMGVTALIAITP